MKLLTPHDRITIYLLLTNKKIPQCLVCLSVIVVLKEYNFKKHYMTNHLFKYEKYPKYICPTIVNKMKLLL